MLPHTVGFNAQAAGTALSPVSDALGDTPGRGLHALSARLDAPTRLSELGLTEADLDQAAAIATRAPYPNPRPFGRDDIMAILRNAFSGERPPY
jgi:maleylacetate reductase